MQKVGNSSCIVLLFAALWLSVSATPKKGFGMCGAAYKCGDTYALDQASWWYNWHYSFVKDQNCSRPHRGEYIPMIWGEKFLKDAVIPADAKYVLGFNEPNAPNQSNLTPERAAELWPQFEEKAGDRILVSPALEGCDIFPESCIDWYDRFFNACQNCRVDKIAIHGYHCVPYELIQSLGKISSRFNRPIWLTEFSCRGNVTVQDDINFINLVVPLLEKASFIEKYAWFCTRRLQVTPFLPNFSTNLLQKDAPALTEVGNAYNSLTQTNL